MHERSFLKNVGLIGALALLALVANGLLNERLPAVWIFVVAISGTLGQEARKLGRARRLYRALRPQALDVLLYIGARVYDLSGARKPLLLTSAVRDDRYQRVLTHVNAAATRAFSMHTTGFAFDIARAYAGRRQARAFQRVLDELQAANAIAYIRENAAIHIAVASDAAAKLKLLETLGA